MATVVVNGKKITPAKIICIGRNYVEHIKELGNEMPGEMVVFLKPNSAISTELNSRHQEPLHYEGELCFLCENGKFSAVGFGLDLTKRTLQTRLKGKGLPWERAKAFDGSAVFSEFARITEIRRPLTIELSIDGQLVQSGNSDLMIYKPQQIIRELATFMTLQDGDIVMTGTPEGVGIIKKGQIFSGTVKDQNDIIVSCQWLAK